MYPDESLSTETFIETHHAAERPHEFENGRTPTTVCVFIWREK